MQSGQHAGCNVTSVEQFTVSEYCSQPEDVVAMRHISSVLLCLNRQLSISMCVDFELKICCCLVMFI